eukprot:TRINITY_DN4687_c0_g2_i8.p1 TRINITY_DN4687_c0_g2~~TRINITY_DN4687_c0_g2_i8.p1  ORF type:complete len:221 (-),score=30.08 TRINITY_DN4687_c0_g2_i8:169-831(-)
MQVMLPTRAKDRTAAYNFARKQVLTREDEKEASSKEMEAKLNRCNMLYNLARIKQNAPAKMAECEREDEECTFHPNTKKDRVDTRPVNVDKATLDLAIERMKRGREQREWLRFALSRGNTISHDKYLTSNLTNDTKQKPHEECESVESASLSLGENTYSEEEGSNAELTETSEEQSNEPLLYIDVNLEGQQKRIVVYKGDSASDLAEKFIKDNGIHMRYW